MPTAQGLLSEQLEKLAVQTGTDLSQLQEIIGGGGNVAGQDIATQALAQQAKQEQEEEFSSIQSELDSATGGVLEGNEVAQQSVEAATNDFLRQRDEKILQDPEAGVPGRKRFKEMSGREKTSAILTVLGNALAVAGSNDPGAAVQRQLGQIMETRDRLAAQRERNTNEAESREFRREQLESASEAEERQSRIEHERQRQLAGEQRDFVLERDWEQFLRESQFDLIKTDISRAEREADRSLQRELSDNQIAERRRVAEANTSKFLIENFGADILSFGANEEGTTDQMARPRRLSRCAEDLSQCSVSDQAILHNAVMKRQGVDERLALQAAAMRLAGTKRTIPEVDPATGEKILDPTTGQPKVKMTPMGEPVLVPMSYEEAAAQVGLQLEDTEFSRERSVEPAVADEVSERQSYLSQLNPADVRPEHLAPENGQPGILSYLQSVSGATTANELAEEIRRYESAQISRGGAPFTKETRAKLEEQLGQRFEAEKTYVGTTYTGGEPSEEEIKLALSLEQSGAGDSVTDALNNFRTSFLLPVAKFTGIKNNGDD